ncbi:MAG: thiamine pyrophosphate-dependent dehydrogenase E1 component subunit alpha [Azoarcus sp.]|nr:thiamine pyrophosphate-dependent dehydrogenase E1 component subunit alpha [Azoarcus sp.]
MNHARSASELLETLLLIRGYEETVIALSAAGDGPGTCTSVGQEASAAGVVAALAPHDRILSNHRSAGHLLARGAEPGRMLAEVLGRSTGYCKGKSGHLHMTAGELGVILTSTIVGGSLSLAPGVALSQTMTRKDDGIVACFFGDGAACQGVFHESLNLAVMWKLPLLYVCENNQWQAYVHRRETMPSDTVSTWAQGHGLPVASVDGNDAQAVQEAARTAVEHIRRHRTPYFLETLTYRTRGHVEPDDQAYVDATELAAWKARDPIALLSRRLLDAGTLDRAGIEALERRVRTRLDAALAFAKDSPFPEPSELTTDVYAEEA